MKVMQIEISTCRECPNYTNSSQLHDCAFTSAPYPLVEYCEFGSRRILRHETARTVDYNCPLDDAEGAQG